MSDWLAPRSACLVVLAGGLRFAVAAGLNGDVAAGGRDETGKVFGPGQWVWTGTNRPNQYALFAKAVALPLSGN